MVWFTVGVNKELNRALYGPGEVVFIRRKIAILKSKVRFFNFTQNKKYWH